MNISSLSFNSDISILTCGTKDGYTVYKLNPSIQKYIYTPTNGSVGLAKILDKTNISILVGKENTDNQKDKKDTHENHQYNILGKNSGLALLKDNKYISAWDVHKKKRELKVILDEPVLNAHVIRRDKKSFIILVVVLMNKICIFNHRGVLINYKDTYDNISGLCVLNTQKNEDMTVKSHTIVTLGIKVGEIAVWDITNDIYKTIQAHTNNVTTVTISKDGRMVATASEIGTIINVYDIETEKELYKFRRGLSNAKIYDMCFNNNNNHLVCCCNTNKIHIFELYDDEKKTKNKRSRFKSFLPNFMSHDYFTYHWSFRKIEIETKNKMICAFDESNTLHIIIFDGSYYRINGTDYSIEKECNLCK